MLRRRLCSLCTRRADVLVTAHVLDTLTFRNCCLACVADRRLLGWTVRVA